MPPTVPTSRAADPGTHPCVRCGAPIPLDDSLCERCNPLGLPAPASSQAHGSIFVALVASIVGLAIVGRLAVGGGSVGPYRASVTHVEPQGPGLQVSVTLTNTGSSAGSPTCRIYDPTVPGIGPDSGYLLSPSVPGGQTLTFSGEVTQLGTSVRPLAADCR